MTLKEIQDNCTQLIYESKNHPENLDFYLDIVFNRIKALATAAERQDKTISNLLITLNLQDDIINGFVVKYNKLEDRFAAIEKRLQYCKQYTSHPEIKPKKVKKDWKLPPIGGGERADKKASPPPYTFGERKEINIQAELAKKAGRIQRFSIKIPHIDRLKPKKAR